MITSPLYLILLRLPSNIPVFEPEAALVLRPSLAGVVSASAGVISPNTTATGSFQCSHIEAVGQRGCCLPIHPPPTLQSLRNRSHRRCTELCRLAKCSGSYSRNGTRADHVR
jgi:hypothetical protein